MPDQDEGERDGQLVFRRYTTRGLAAVGKINWGQGGGGIHGLDQKEFAVAGCCFGTVLGSSVAL